MKPSEVLSAAKALIDAPEKLAKGDLATDENGEWADHCGPKAKCFCPIGAICRVEDSASPPIFFGNARRYLRAAIAPRHIIFWNDDPKRTHAEVMSAFDRAITLAQEAGE